MTTRTYSEGQVEKFKAEILAEMMKHIMAGDMDGEFGYSALDSFFDWVSGPAEGVDPEEYWEGEEPEWHKWDGHLNFASRNWELAEELSQSQGLIHLALMAKDRWDNDPSPQDGEPDEEEWYQGSNAEALKQ